MNRDSRRVSSAPTERETPIINHSWTTGTTTSRGSTINKVVNRDFVQIMNHQTGSVDLYLVKGFGDRELVASKNRGDIGWTSKLTTASVLDSNERNALLKELKSGSAFNRKLDNIVLTTAAKDFKGGLSDSIDIYGKSINLTSSPADQSRGGDVDGNSGGINPSSSTQEQGSTPSITPDDSKRIYNIISNGQKARTKYDGELKYPEKYDGNDYLTIEMIRYVPNKNLSLGRVGSDQDSGELFDTNLGLPGISERSSSEKTIARFTLPIPANLIDANPVNWSQDELNPLQAYGAGAIGRILGSNNFASGIGNELKRGSETLRANSDAAKTVLNNELIRQILGVNTLTRSTGAIVNPNVELLFKGPSLRTFTFSFKMTPRSQKESEIIKKIIRRLKQGMSIKRASNGIFLASPNVFKLKFWYVPPVSENDSVTGGTPREHPYLPKFKVCALQNMSVNYMPDGSYMTYGDGSMIGYDMTLTFSEIDPIFDEDYTKLDGDKDESIGY